LVIFASFRQIAPVFAKLRQFSPNCANLRQFPYPNRSFS
jgi:hypothetical protein